jgi:hypothetical protein
MLAILPDLLATYLIAQFRRVVLGRRWHLGLALGGSCGPCQRPCVSLAIASIATTLVTACGVALGYFFWQAGWVAGRARLAARLLALKRVAFRHLHGVGTQDRTLSRLDGWPMRAPVDASPMPSQATAHDSGSMWFAIPSSQGHPLLLADLPGASQM